MRIPDFGEVKALVIGDVILDQYVHGRVPRISPEAPVPVFNVESTTCVAGGAANVAMNLAALGCHVTLMGAIADDREGELLRRELDRGGIRYEFAFAAADVTTCKTRYVVGDKHLLRMDRDARVQWRSAGIKRFSKWISRELKKIDVIIISDYGKGVLADDICRVIISLATNAGVPVMVDPKGRDYSKYAGATLIKPNFKEFVEATGCTADFRENNWQNTISRAAVELCEKVHVDAILVTLSERGMMYVPSDVDIAPLYLAAEAKEVFDVSGAGDTSISVVSAALAAKMPVPEAIGLANIASGIAVAKAGTSVVSLVELETANSDKCGTKVVSADECARLTAALKRQGKVIGFTNGCFDCCHLGHVSSIKAAKAQCDVLVVGVNSDSWIRRHKGRGRPIQDEATRVGVLSAMEDVDFVVLFSSPTALSLVRKIRPQVIAKEGYAIDDWPEARYVSEYGGRVVKLEHVEGYSTTAIESRIRSSV